MMKLHVALATSFVFVCALYLCACESRTDAAEEATLRAEVAGKWANLSKMYADQGQQTQEIGLLNATVLVSIERQALTEVKVAEARVQVLLAQYVSNQGIYAYTGAGLRAQYAQEDLIKSARLAVLQTQIRALDRKLPFVRAFENLQSHTQNKACLESALPIETEREAYARCETVFAEIERDQRMYVDLVATSRTVAIKTNIFGRYLERSRERHRPAVTAYNEAVSNYQRTIKSQPIKDGVNIYQTFALPLNNTSEDQNSVLNPQSKTAQTDKPKTKKADVTIVVEPAVQSSLEDEDTEGAEPQDEVVDMGETPAQIRLRNAGGDSSATVSNSN